MGKFTLPERFKAAIGIGERTAKKAVVKDFELLRSVGLSRLPIDLAFDQLPGSSEGRSL